MKVYIQWARGKVNTMLVSPGKDHPENTAWNTNSVVEGRTISQPMSFAVKFVKGVAEVDSQIGKYLIDKGLAFKSPQDEVSGVHNTLVLASSLEEAFA